MSYTKRSTPGKIEGKSVVTGLQQNYMLASYYSKQEKSVNQSMPVFGQVSGFGPISNLRSARDLPSYNTLEHKLRDQLSTVDSADAEMALASYLQGVVYS